MREAYTRSNRSVKGNVSLSAAEPIGGGMGGGVYIYAFDTGMWERFNYYTHMPR